MDESPQTLFQAAFPVSVFSTAMLILILAYLAWVEIVLLPVRPASVEPPPYGGSVTLYPRPEEKSVKADKQPAGGIVIEK
jgi:hypothetical protein